MSGLKRYTQLPFLLHMLRRGEIALLSPTTWDDRNDTYFIEQYRQYRKAKSIYVLCLTRAAATYHHWRVFAGNPSGVRIDFDEAKFSAWARAIPGARLEDVDYIKLDRAKLAKKTQEDYPFVKRHAFRDEGEVRLIIEDRNGVSAAKLVPFVHTMIRGVVASPWLPESVFESVHQSIRDACPTSTFKIRRTTMLLNEVFVAAGSTYRQ